MTEYRQFAQEGTYHIFPDGAKPEMIVLPSQTDGVLMLVPVCGMKMAGAWTVPIPEAEVPKYLLCKACKCQNTYSARLVS